MLVCCLECKKEFIPDSININIAGPFIKVFCPFCSYVYEGKFLNFVELQMGGYKPSSVEDARKMIELARFMELNSSDYYKKRGLRHGKKKVPNV